ncbi:ribonuclease H-like domain-containing protein [Mycena olivaceomarginata]|nr:ribonuclease H-like domain-containing protein [Mycena olivaceomarginata]
MLLALWVDDLTEAAVNAIEASGAPLPRGVRTTAAKRLLEDETRKKIDDHDKEVKKAKKLQTEKAKKKTEQGAKMTLQPNRRQRWVRESRKYSSSTNSSSVAIVEKDPDIRRVRCAGLGCHESWAQPRMSGRILPHACDCKYLPRALRDEALSANAGKSLGAQLAETDGAQKDFFGAFKRAGAVDKAAARDAHPGNDIKVASTFSENYIPAEAARVTLLAIAELKKQYNPNLATTEARLWGQQSIYTFHVTTSDREAYLSKATKPQVSRTLHRNTKLARELAQIEVPTLLLVPDPDHHLSNTIKDICKIEYFVDIVHRQNESNPHLFLALHLFGNSFTCSTCYLRHQQGLEKIGKTRFGTIYWAGYALLRNLPPIVELVQTGIIDVDAEKDKLGWFKQLRVLHDFELELQQLCHILEPIAWAIKCLEGLEVTVGDVFKFYVAITAVLRDFFESNSLSVPSQVREEVCSIINRRYDEMIHGPSGDLFLSGFFLDPEHVKSPILFKSSANQLQNPTAITTHGSTSKVTDQDLRDSMPPYVKVGEFLFQVLAKELQSSRDVPAFHRYSSASGVMDAFKSQFESYTRQYPPFSVRSTTWSKAIQYWRSLEHVPEASIIAFVAIKIFSILANSMPEERTVSRFTRTDTRDRANQDARTIVDQTKIYQHLWREARAADKKQKETKAPSINWWSVKGLFTETKPKAVIDLTNDTSDNAPPRRAGSPQRCG